MTRETKFKTREQLFVGDKVYYQNKIYPIMSVSKTSFIRGMWEIEVLEDNKSQYFGMAKGDKIEVIS